jgi:hypothetical protein
MMNKDDIETQNLATPRSTNRKYKYNIEYENIETYYRIGNNY